MKFGDEINWDIHVKEIIKDTKNDINKIFYKHDSNDLIFSNIKKYLVGENGEIKNKNFKLLDAGCHICRWIKYWEDSGFIYNGIDQSSDAIRFCKTHYPEDEIINGGKRKYYNMYLWQMRFKEEFDVITCISVLQHNKMYEKQLILPNIYHALKSEGLFFIMESPVPEETETQLTPEGWISLVEKFGFKHLESWHPSSEYLLNDCHIFRKLPNQNIKQIGVKNKLK